MSLTALTCTVCPTPTRTLAPIGVTRPEAIVTSTMTSATALCQADDDGTELPSFTGVGDADDATVDPLGPSTSPAAQPAAMRTSSSAAAAS